MEKRELEFVVGLAELSEHDREDLFGVGFLVPAVDGG